MAKDEAPPVPPSDPGEDPQLELFDAARRGAASARRRAPRPRTETDTGPVAPAVEGATDPAVTGSELYHRTMAAAAAERARLLDEVRQRQDEIRRMERETGASLVRQRL